MKELNENCVYYLEELTSEEKQKLLEKLIELDSTWEGESLNLQLFSSSYLYFSDNYRVVGEWLVSEGMYFTSKETRNAKELFYTLENVQVDCRDLEQKEISLIGNIYKSKGYTLSDRYNKITNDDYYISLNKGISSYGFYEIDDDCTTITYEKFMELFAEPQYEVKMIVEAPKPEHYAKGIDTFARMEANCTTEECLAFAKGNIDKYNFRTKGQDLEDYKKIVSYANWAIKLLENAKNN